MKIFDTLKKFFNKQTKNDDTPLPEKQEELETFNTPLPEDYIDLIFEEFIKNNNISDLPDDKYPEIKNSFIRARIQPLKDDICSFDINRSEKAIGNFIELTGFNVDPEAFDKLEYFDMLKYHVSNVPAFSKVYDCIELYQNYYELTSVGNQNFNTKSIVEFTNKIDKASPHLSNNNLANMYYYAAQLYDNFLFTIKQKDSQFGNLEQISNKQNDYLIKTLHLTDDPQRIEFIKESLTPSTKTTTLVRQACARALQNAANKSHFDNFTAYKILGDTYDKAIGSFTGYKITPYQIIEQVNANAAIYFYEQALYNKVCACNQVEATTIKEKITSLEKIISSHNPANKQIISEKTNAEITTYFPQTPQNKSR